MITSTDNLELIDTQMRRQWAVERAIELVRHTGSGDVVAMAARFEAYVVNGAPAKGAKEP